MNEHSVKMIYVLLIPNAVSHLLLISFQAIGYGNVTYIRAYIHTYIHTYIHAQICTLKISLNKTTVNPIPSIHARKIHSVNKDGVESL